MNIEKMFSKYVEEKCKKCKNRKLNLCKITIRECSKEIKAKCDYYEKED